MLRPSSNLVTRLYVTQLLFFFTISPWLQTEAAAAAAAITTELVKGFTATPDPSTTSFQPLLTDPTSNFSLGFLRVNRTQLAVAVLHLPSSESLWMANPTHLAGWSKSTRLFFNGSLVISDPHTRVFWSTDTDGDRVSLLNTSNLQIEKLAGNDNNNPSVVVWQSFQFPTNTLVENQNFTVEMSLVSSNGLYSMRLGDDYIGLFYKSDFDQMYWKHKALQAKAAIVEGKGPIYARVNSVGYLGMYQTNDTLPVDVEAFNSFQRPINGLLMLRLEPDGNLKGYYWDGSNWVLDYQGIRSECELPSRCGSYGLCKPGGGGCSCLNNRTEYVSGGCSAPGSGDFCGVGVAVNGFSVLRREGVELPYKELMGYETTPSLEQCEGLCANNCSCWGAVYNNASGFCYLVDYPIQTLLSVGDVSKVGYFKVRKGAGEKVELGLKVGIGVMTGVILMLAGVAFGFYKFWKKKRGAKLFLEEENGMSPGPYKDLASASFRSIELCNR